MIEDLWLKPKLKDKTMIDGIDFNMLTEIDTIAIRSTSGEKNYAVSCWSDGSYTCSCKGFHFYKAICRHIEAASGLRAARSHANLAQRRIREQAQRLTKLSSEILVNSWDDAQALYEKVHAIDDVLSALSRLHRATAEPRGIEVLPKSEIAEPPQEPQARAETRGIEVLPISNIDAILNPETFNTSIPQLIEPPKTSIEVSRNRDNAILPISEKTVATYPTCEKCGKVFLDPICENCLAEKETDPFSDIKPETHNSYCAEYRKNYYLNNRDKMLANSKARYHRMKDKCNQINLSTSQDGATAV